MRAMRLILNILMFGVGGYAHVALSAATASINVQGPITGGSRGHPFASYLGDISSVGYVEEEYFISGTATNYHPVGSLGENGMWTITTNTSSTYKTRILVRRPTNNAGFNGDVVIEWINVSAGFDILTADAQGLYEAGYIYVAVSAQVEGINGISPNAIGLVEWDAERYSTLHIQDDSFSYDIFTQAAEVLRQEASGIAGNRRLVLGGSKPQHIIAVGSSQSGTRMLAYANGVQPLTNMFNAIIPVICAGSAADFTSITAVSNLSTPGFSIPALARTDSKIPIFEINTQTEALVYFTGGRRQPDTNVFRYWEITGSSHGPVPEVLHVEAVEQRDGLIPSGPLPVPAGSNVTWVPSVDAAYRHVSTWIRTGNPPISMPKMEITGDATTAAFIFDPFGNVLGGVRLPEITVPIATYSGTVPNNLFSGSTTPFNATELRRLYPSHTAYVTKLSAAALIALDEGIILDYRVAQYIHDAQTANVPSQ